MTTIVSKICRDVSATPRKIPFSCPTGPFELPIRTEAEAAFATVGLTIASYELNEVSRDVWVETSCGRSYFYGTFYEEDCESFTLVEEMPNCEEEPSEPEWNLLSTP